MFLGVKQYPGASAFGVARESLIVFYESLSHIICLTDIKIAGLDALEDVNGDHVARFYLHDVGYSKEAASHLFGGVGNSDWLWRQDSDL